MEKILFLGNCQFAKLGALTRTTSIYKTAQHRTITPYWGKFDEAETREQLAEADLVVAQMISNKDTTFHIDDVKTATKGETVFLPYVYVDGLADLELISSKGKATIKGSEPLMEMAENLEHNKIINAFINGRIDLKVKERFQHSISEMRRRERDHCAIKISDFIEEIHTTQVTNYAINHPSEVVVFELFHRLFQQLNIHYDRAKLQDPVLKGRMALPLALKSLTPYTVAMHGLEYSPDTHWYANGVRLINMALKQTKIKAPFNPEDFNL